MGRPGFEGGSYRHGTASVSLGPVETFADDPTFPFRELPPSRIPYKTFRRWAWEHWYDVKPAQDGGVCAVQRPALSVEPAITAMQSPVAGGKSNAPGKSRVIDRMAGRTHKVGLGHF